MSTIFYLSPSSFCFGVKRAIDKLKNIVEDKNNEKIYCIHELIHNPNVNNFFKEKWVIFVEKHTEIKDKNAIIIFSAHWTNRKTLEDARKKFKEVINLECPLVSKIYTEIDNYINQWITNFFYIGKKNHQEADNIVNYIKYRGLNFRRFLDIEKIPQINKKTSIAVLSQTTLNFSKIEILINKIKKLYPNSLFPQLSDICKATHERQNVIQQNLTKFEKLVVIGGKNSSNTKELVKIWEKNKKKTFFAESLKNLLEIYNKSDLINTKTLAITGGASTPQKDIKEVFDYFKEQGFEQKILSL